jgi:hypothetical protein
MFVSDFKKVSSPNPYSPAQKVHRTGETSGCIDPNFLNPLVPYSDTILLRVLSATRILPRQSSNFITNGHSHSRNCVAWNERMMTDNPFQISVKTNNRNHRYHSHVRTKPAKTCQNISYTQQKTNVI